MTNCDRPFFTNNNMNEVFMKFLPRLAFYGGISLWCLAADANPWQTPTQEKIAFYVNNSPITENDQAFVHRKMRGNAVAYFSKEYGPLPSGNFWQQCLGGTSVQQWIEQQTLNEFIQTYAHLSMMYRYGVTKKQLSYADLKQMMIKENNKRSQAIANSQVVYGLASFNFDKYKSHTLSNGFNKVREQLKKRYPISSQEQEKIYQQRKDHDFLESMTFSIQAIKLHSASTLKNTKVINELHHQLDTLRSVTLKNKYKANANFTYLEKHFSAQSRKSDEFVWSQLINQVKHQNKGDFFQSQDIDGTHYLIKLIEKSQPKSQPLSEVKHIIANDYAEQRYQKELDKIISQTTIIHNPQASKVKASNTVDTCAKSGANNAANSKVNTKASALNLAK